MSIDLYNQIPLPEIYTAMVPRTPVTNSHLTRPVLCICDLSAFNREWDNMEANMHFLLYWRGISEEKSMD